ncbi:hypothetical protein JHK82_027327 [Glycine max]|nr:hypothetical protein JHK87_027229 [Glycine soja]KAG4996530.1 hypothetical protein JHK85_027969 [Glycine max]KAG5126492.1 hypothetical protein JHK82_027327 [Glycine max]
MAHIVGNLERALTICNGRHDSISSGTNVSAYSHSYKPVHVGPFLIGNLVQYLNAEHKFQNEGYVLAMTFVASKLLECVPDRDE